MSPMSTIKSNWSGFSGWMVIPRKRAGVKAGLRPTMVPGAGRFRTCAKDWDGMTRLTVKVTRMKKEMTLTTDFDFFRRVKCIMVRWPRFYNFLNYIRQYNAFTKMGT